VTGGVWLWLNGVTSHADLNCEVLLGQPAA
jgi:hypothetical protein